MKEFFNNSLGVDHETFSYVVLPILIFLARIMDVSINTLRIIFVMGGRKLISTILGFFESLIWLLAIGQIFQNIDNVASYIAYPLGFATGIFVGMLIEERLALGKVVVRVISSNPFEDLLGYVNERKYKHILIEGFSGGSPERILFTVLKRDELPTMEENIKNYMPTSFYTIETIKQANELGFITEKPSRRGIGTWLGSIKRK